MVYLSLILLKILLKHFKEGFLRGVNHSLETFMSLNSLESGRTDPHVVNKEASTNLSMSVKASVKRTTLTSRRKDARDGFNFKPVPGQKDFCGKRKMVSEDDCS